MKKYFKYRNENVRNMNVKLGEHMFFANNFGQIETTEEQAEFIKENFPKAVSEIEEKEYISTPTPSPSKISASELNNYVNKLQKQEEKLKVKQAELEEREVKVAEKEETIKNKLAELESRELAIKKVEDLQGAKEGGPEDLVKHLKTMKVDELKEMAETALLPKKDWEKLKQAELVEYLAQKL